jgi:glucose-6-phosphate dehydrogenase assembly protein OpcA
VATTLTDVETHEWAGRDIRVSDIEQQVARLREAVYTTGAPDLRTNVLTAIAWVPDEFRSRAEEVLAGLAERHPSRAIVLVPDADADDGLDAELTIRCRPFPGAEKRKLCYETMRLRLRGRRVQAPASIAEPLLIPDLPVFLRWRGEPPIGAVEFEQLVGVADRLVVDSEEWRDLPEAFARFVPTFGEARVSDLAWTRTLPWRSALAGRWPDIGRLEQLAVTGPLAQALLLAGWLRSRLEHDVELVHSPAERLERLEVDGDPVERPRIEPRSPADELSEEFEVFTRDPIYEAAVRDAPAAAPAS